MNMIVAVECLLQIGRSGATYRLHRQGEKNQRARNNVYICKISYFHGGDYEEWRLLGCYAVLLL
jgi:hypothetical protein